MSNIKGELSISVMIMAIVGLIVLVILIAIFTGKFSIFGKETTDQSENAKRAVCTTRGGTCVSGSNCGSSGTKIEVCSSGDTNCNNQNSYFIDCGQGNSCCTGTR